MFDPIIPPPSPHHPLATGHSTEFGDSAKVAMEKINAGFKHVYGVLKGLGASLADEVEYVAKKDFDDLDAFVTKLLNSHGELSNKVTELEAEVRNLKMMVQGLGFAGLEARQTLIGDPSHQHARLDGGPINEPVVTVKEVTEQ